MVTSHLRLPTCSREEFRTMATARSTKLALQTFAARPEAFAVTSTLVTGATDAVLIDAQFSLAEARRLVESIQRSGKRLTTVYVTHAHPDHYFGLGEGLHAFPG